MQRNDTVDGSEILHQIDMENLLLFLQGFLPISGGCFGFLPLTVGWRNFTLYLDTPWNFRSMEPPKNRCFGSMFFFPFPRRHFQDSMFFQG